jgi:hypothetical protein
MSHGEVRSYAALVKLLQNGAFDFATGFQVMCNPHCCHMSDVELRATMTPFDVITVVGKAHKDMCDARCHAKGDDILTLLIDLPGVRRWAVA